MKHLVTLVMALVLFLSGTADAQRVDVRTDNARVAVGRGGLFGRNVVVDTRGAGQQVVVRGVSPIRSVTYGQLLVDRHHRGQLNLLNTFTYANSTPANIRYLRQNIVYVQEPPVTSAPIIERYVVPAPQQYRTMPYTEPETLPQPQAEDPCGSSSSSAYLTQPQRVVTTQRRVYYTLPQRVQRLSGGCY